MSDAILMDLLRSDSAAFAELYRRYEGRMYHYFLRMLNNDSEKAKDFLHDIFVKLFHYADSFNSDARFTTWIYTMAYNMCKNEYRKTASRQYETFEEAIPVKIGQNTTETIEQETDFKAFSKALEDELNMVDSEQRSIFLLRYQADLPIKEIKNIVGCAEGTIKSRLFYLTKKLAKNLRAYNPNMV